MPLKGRMSAKALHDAAAGSSNADQALRLPALALERLSEYADHQLSIELEESISGLESENKQGGAAGMSFREIEDKITGARLNYDPNREFSDEDYQNELRHFEQNVRSNIDGAKLGQVQKENLTDRLYETMAGLRTKRRSR